jgi:uncharacterized protein (TIGR02588 family)
MTKRTEKNGEIPAWEWVVGAIGLVFVVASIGFMLYQAFVVDEIAPEIVFETEEIVRSGSIYLVKVQVANHGEMVVAGLVIEGILMEGEEEVEISETIIDYVPAGSQRKAGLFFTRNPQEFDLQLRAKSYVEP